MGFLDRLFGRRRRDTGNGTTASTTPTIYPDQGSTAVDRGDAGDRGEKAEGEGESGEGAIEPSSQQIDVGGSGATQDVDVGDSGDSGGGDGGGGNGGGNGGGGNGGGE